jgi:hypothetical protein
MLIQYMKTEEIVKWFVLFIIAVKFAYSAAYYGNLIMTNISDDFAKDFKKYDPLILHWKHVTEFIFVLCMSILLIYHFYPTNGIIQQPIVVDKETRVLFLLYGFILIFSAKWTLFFDEKTLFIKFINKFK